MKNFVKALAEHDLFIICHYDKDKVDDECKNMIDYVIKFNELTAQGLLEQYGLLTVYMYITLCNSYDRMKYETELLKHITRIS